nr:MAG TPA: Pf48/45, 85RF45.1 Fab heavy chain, transmission-blocking, antigen, antibody, IMMUNE [Caudoviricetes sp.]
MRLAVHAFFINCRYRNGVILMNQIIGALCPYTITPT